MTWNEVFAFAIFISFVCIGVCYIVYLMVFLIKEKTSPPCVDCAHYESNNKSYSGIHYCNKVRDKVDGSPESCRLVRHTTKCWFKKKQ